MKTNNFDKVMHHIDENILKDDDEIKRGIYDLINYGYTAVNLCFKTLTGETLVSYIKQRRLYFAAMDIRFGNESFIEISQKYGYSEQSAFNRAMKNMFGFTPKQIRDEDVPIIDNQIRYSDFDNFKISNSKVQRIMNKTTEQFSHNDLEYLYELEMLSEESLLDIDSIYMISDLAEKLDLPIDYLVSVISNAYEEYIPEMNYRMSSKSERMYEIGINSEQELEKIKQYYQCEDHELTYFMVKSYKDKFIK